MNAPIESLINYSKSQSNLSKGNARSKTISRRPLTVRIDQRAQTAIGSKKPDAKDIQGKISVVSNYLTQSSYQSKPMTAEGFGRATSSHSQNRYIGLSTFG